MNHTKPIDWIAIEIGYKAGAPLRELAAKHGASPSGISKRARSKAWVRDAGAASAQDGATGPEKVHKTEVHKPDCALLHDSAEEDQRRWESSFNPEDEEEVSAGKSGGWMRRRDVFVDEYLVDLNATQAAIRAGYSPKAARVQGCRLIANDNIQAQIKRRIKDREARTEINQNRALYELSAMAFYDPADIGSVRIDGPADIAKLPERVRRAIIGWSWDKHGNFVLKLATKTPNVELIGRHLGMFKDKLEVTEVGPLPEVEYKIVYE